MYFQFLHEKIFFFLAWNMGLMRGWRFSCCWFLKVNQRGCHLLGADEYIYIHIFICMMNICIATPWGSQTFGAGGAKLHWPRSLPRPKLFELSDFFSFSCTVKNFLSNFTIKNGKSSLKTFYFNNITYQYCHLTTYFLHSYVYMVINTRKKLSYNLFLYFYFELKWFYQY